MESRYCTSQELLIQRLKQSSSKMEVNQDTQEKIQRLQMIEQNLQNFMAQKQQFQSQLFELENALKELGTTSQAYKIIGNIMVASDKEALTKDLEQKKEIAELRISSIEKQEKQLKEKAKKIQEEVMGNMKKNE